MSKLNVLFVFGTRPEAIKMAPVIHACQSRNDEIAHRICITGQHKKMLDQAMEFFQLNADYDLAAMKPNQSLFDITTGILTGLENVLKDCHPDVLLVQGDTTTAMAASLAGFYVKTRVGHVEAGLRSFEKYAPYPEEINRKIVGSIADYHFSPTPKAKENLEKENTNANVFVTGNTVIDALLWSVEKVRKNDAIAEHFHFLDLSKKVVLVTAHRRESFGKPFEDISDALLSLAKSQRDIQIVYPVHLNPNVQTIVYQKLSEQPNIFLIDPLEYPYLIWLMDKSYFVITDSGGIQEEAPALGKPVLVLRDVTERQEGIEAGTAVLVGTSPERIFNSATQLLHDETFYRKLAQAVNPYGDGRAAERIVSILLNEKTTDFANH